MVEFVVSKSAISTSQILDNLEHCKNTTVGENKYQLYCINASDTDGSCVLLPSVYLDNGKINCNKVTGDVFLNRLYDETGNACAINCYYPLGSLVPTISYSYPSATYSYPSNTYSSAKPYDPFAKPSYEANADKAVSSSVAAASSPAVSPLPASESSLTNPNLLLTFLVVFAVMVMMRHRAI